MGSFCEDRRSGDAVLRGAVNGHGLIEPVEQGLEIDEVSEGLGSRFPKSVDVYGSRGDHPELVEILGNDMEVVGLADKESHRIKGFLMHRMSRLDKPC